MSFSWNLWLLVLTPHAVNTRLFNRAVHYAWMNATKMCRNWQALVWYSTVNDMFNISKYTRPTTNYSFLFLGQPRWLSGLMRSRVHSLWLLVDHCVLRNWDRILVRAVKGLISRAGMVSICPLLWQRDVKLQQTFLFLTSLYIFISFDSKIRGYTYYV